jgi:hypothetical protein
MTNPTDRDTVENPESPSKVLLICSRGTIWDEIVSARLKLEGKPRVFEDVVEAARELQRIELKAMFVALGDDPERWDACYPYFHSHRLRAPVFFLRDEREPTVEQVVNMTDVVALLPDFSMETLCQLPIHEQSAS